MVFCVSVKMPRLAFFHLSVHAIFKSLIFICVGVLIHCYQTQDLRKIGGAAARLPFVSFVIVSAELRIAGFPFLSGFFSKDLIIEGAAQNRVNSVCYLLVIFSVFCTVFYSVRLTGIVLHYKMRREPLLNTFDSRF
jgi:NADH-ubiquinone oxidoreductase chain 5